MKIDVFTICYNEEVLMPYFLRHYSTFCDRITIYDNQSTDRTVEIAKQNSKVKVISYNSDNKIRDDIYRQIKNNCWKQSDADWVIVCDMDEFVYMVPGDTRMNDYTIIKPRWWEMISDHLPETEGQIYEEISYGVPSGRPAKALMFSPKFVKEIGYGVGAHAIHPKGDVRVLETPFINVLHFKMLSLDYFINRFALLRSRLSDLNKQRRWGYHYEFSKEQLTKDYNEAWNNKKQIPV